MTLQFKDSIGQLINLRDVVVYTSEGNREPLLVTKFTPKQIRLSNGTSTLPSYVTVVTAQVDAFNPSIRAKLLEKYDHCVDESQPVVKRKVRYMVTHVFPYGKYTEGEVHIVKLDFCDAAERAQQMRKHEELYGNNRDCRVLFAGNQHQAHKFTKLWRVNIDQRLMSERVFCSITSLDPGVYDWSTWLTHLMPTTQPIQYET